jgi:hypothetical protein
MRSRSLSAAAAFSRSSLLRLGLSIGLRNASRLLLVFQSAAGLGQPAIHCTAFTHPHQPAAAPALRLVDLWRRSGFPFEWPPWRSDVWIASFHSSCNSANTSLRWRSRQQPSAVQDPVEPLPVPSRSLLAAAEPDFVYERQPLPCVRRSARLSVAFHHLGLVARVEAFPQGVVRHPPGRSVSLFAQCASCSCILRPP